MSDKETDMDTSPYSWMEITGMCLLTQAVIGLFLLEWVLFRNRRIINVDEMRDRQFPGLRRYDAQYWTRLRLYPGALLFMPTRVFMAFLNLFLCSICIYVSCICHDFEKGPIVSKIRNAFISFFMKFWSIIATFFFGRYYSNVKNLDNVDYSEYLGQEYKELETDINTSTIVSNHVSWLEPLIMTRQFNFSVATSEDFKNLPIISKMMKGPNSIFLPRFSSPGASQ